MSEAADGAQDWAGAHLVSDTLPAWAADPKLDPPVQDALTRQWVALVSSPRAARRGPAPL